MSKLTARAKFIRDVSELAGQLFDRMEAMSKKEIDRVKQAAAEALRKQLVEAFVKLDPRARLADEVTITVAAEPIDTGHIRKALELPEPSSRTSETPSEKPVARRRRNASATPARRVAPADITADLATEIGGGARSVVSKPGRPVPGIPHVHLRHGGGYDPRKGREHPDNFDETLEETPRRRSGKPPELGMRSRERVAQHLEMTKLAISVSHDMVDADVATYWCAPDIEEIKHAEASKHAGVKLEDVDIRSTWVV